TYQKCDNTCEPEIITRFAIKVIKDILDNSINQGNKQEKRSSWPGKLVSGIHDTSNYRINKRLLNHIEVFIE
ncbi:hypothetical protein DKM28_01175, partial [Methanosarcina mazei]